MGQYDTLTNMALSFGDGNENPSGIGEVGYLIPLSWMATIQKPVAGVAAESLVEITGNHVMKAGKSPIPVTPLFDKSGINWKLAGEMLSKIFEQGAELFIPDNSAVSLGTLTALKNYRYIYIGLKLDGSGDFFQIGSEAISAKISDMPGGTGIGPTGEVGSKVMLSSHGPAPVYIYKGDVPPVGV